MSWTHLFDWPNLFAHFCCCYDDWGGEERRGEKRDQKVITKKLQINQLHFLSALWSLLVMASPVPVPKSSPSAASQATPPATKKFDSSDAPNAASQMKQLTPQEAKDIGNKLGGPQPIGFVERLHYAKVIRLYCFPPLLRMSSFNPVMMDGGASAVVLDPATQTLVHVWKTEARFPLKKGSVKKTKKTAPKSTPSSKLIFPPPFVPPSSPNAPVSPESKADLDETAEIEEGDRNLLSEETFKLLITEFKQPPSTPIPQTPSIDDNGDGDGDGDDDSYSFGDRGRKDKVMKMRLQGYLALIVELELVVGSMATLSSRIKSFANSSSGPDAAKRLASEVILNTLTISNDQKAKSFLEISDMFDNLHETLVADGSLNSGFVKTMTDIISALGETNPTVISQQRQKLMDYLVNVAEHFASLS